MRSPASLSERLRPLTGVWLCLGVVCGWFLFALDRPWGAGIATGSALVALVVRPGWSGGAAILAGFALQTCVSLAWHPFATPGRTESRLVAVSERRVGPGKSEGRILSADSGALAGLVVRFPGGRPGDTLEGNALFQPPRPRTVPGGFDERAWAASEGLDGRLAWKGDGPSLRRGTPGMGERVETSVRAWVKRILRDRLETSSATLWIGTILSETRDIPPEAMEAFRQSGMFHMLSVSGFHMAVLGGGLVALLGLLRVPKRPAWLLAAAVVLAYTWLLGGSPPVTRSALAFALAAVALVAGRRVHAGNSLCLALALLLAWDPNSAYQMGAQLTFAATAALLWLAPALRTILVPLALRGGRVDRWLLEPLLLSVAATLATAPILAWHVGAVAWIGIPAGFAAATAFSAGFLAALATVVLGWLPAWATSGFAGAADLSARVVWELTLRAGAWEKGVWIVGRPAAATLALWACALVLLCLTVHRSHRAKAWIGFCLVGAWLVAPPVGISHRPRTLEILTLDVGQGSAALVRWPSGRVWLVDAGPASRTSPQWNAGRTAIFPVLRLWGVRGPDLVAISHADLDHWGGLAWLAGRIPPATLLLSADSGTPGSPPFDSLVGALRGRGWPVARVAMGQNLSYGDGARCEVLGPGLAEPMPRNRTSLVLRFGIDSTRAIVSGDADSVEEASMLASGESVRAGALVVGHHGSRHSSSTAWLRAVGASEATLSYGDPNRYGHPNAEVLERLAASGTRIGRTPTGSVDLVLDGRRMDVSDRFATPFEGPWRRGEISLRIPWISTRR